MNKRQLSVMMINEFNNSSIVDFLTKIGANGWLQVREIYNGIVTFEHIGSNVDNRHYKFPMWELDGLKLHASDQIWSEEYRTYYSLNDFFEVEGNLEELFKEHQLLEVA